MMGYMNNWFGFGFGGIFMILFWAMIAIGIIALINWFNDQSKSKNKPRSAVETLKQRYAKGEIDKKEYEEKLKDLQS
jgi:putative membrane protein